MYQQDLTMPFGFLLSRMNMRRVTRVLIILPSTNGWGPKISEVQDKTFPDFLGRQVTLQAFPDNVNDFYRTGKTNIYSASFEGGGEGTDYRFGYTNTTQTGIIPGEKLNKSAVSFNAGRNIMKGLDIRTNINYTRVFADGRPVESSNNPNVLQNLILNIQGRLIYRM